MSSTENALLKGFSRLESRRNGHDPVWLKAFRRAAFQRVSERGFPTVKDEAWKYTPVGRILNVAFEPAEASASCRLPSAAIDQLAGDQPAQVEFRQGQRWQDSDAQALPHQPDRRCHVRHVVAGRRRCRFGFILRRLVVEFTHA